MKEIEKFYQSIMQDVVAMQSGDEDGNIPESVWTCCPMQPKRRTYRLPTTNAI